MKTAAVTSKSKPSRAVFWLDRCFTRLLSTVEIVAVAAVQLLLINNPQTKNNPTTTPVPRGGFKRISRFRPRNTGEDVYFPVTTAQSQNSFEIVHRNIRKPPRINKLEKKQLHYSWAENIQTWIFKKVRCL